MKRTLLISSLLISFTISNDSVGQITNYAPIPYSTGFENGTLDANWHTTSDHVNGRIQIWNSTDLYWSGDTAKAHTDSMWLGLDCNPGATYVTNEAWFGLNLNNESQVRLSFWWSDWNDETEAQDGIYISDNGGTTFTKVIDLNGASYTDLQWNYFDVSLDSINNVHGLNFTSTYVVKLQQYDNYYFAGGNDGFLFDDINVESTLSTDVNELKRTKIKIYPNPTSNYINISLSNSNENYNYKLVSIDGKILESENSVMNNYIKLDLSNYSQGVYFLNIYDGKNIISSSKVFKQ